jgi:hypothetical protein
LTSQLPDRTAERPFGATTALCLALSLILASTAGIAAAASQPRRPDRMVAIFPPWWTPAMGASAAAANGALSASGGWRNSWIVQSDAPDLEARLRRSGALLLLDSTLARDCAEPQERPRP